MQVGKVTLQAKGQKQLFKDKAVILPTGLGGSLFCASYSLEEFKLCM